MKIYIIPTFIFICLLIGDTGRTQIKPSSINKKMSTKRLEFAKQVFTALKKNDEVLWASLHPTDKEYRSLLEMMLAAKMEGLTQQKINDMTEQRRREASTVFKKELQDLQSEAVKRGVGWSNAIYQEFDSEATYPENFPKKYLNGDIWFAGQDGYYIIEGIEAIETDNGYKLQAIAGIRQVQESY